MKFAPLAAFLAGIALSAAPAFAHDDAQLDKAKTPNGGQLRQAGPYHYELVTARDGTDAKESPVVVYVTDDGGKKVSTAGASGTATVLSGKAKATAALAPDGDNRMSGVAKYASTPDMKVVVSITLSGKQPEQARFTPLSIAKGAPAGQKR
ncbi:MAG: hypothetical protein A3F75_04710 [Betaproteobacteria bacterium RIFCSPLOWO2_12_FULL_64_23]|nr:MAG: hypothetical protein A3F75_04710 [Betaproteobacteria bacterium RIFCSPLOWO2_12_FULL_64_23]